MIAKYAGALCLLYLGFQALRTPQTEMTSVAPKGGESRAHISRRIRRCLRNPKTAADFAAFLPQFMNGDSPSMLQSIARGCLFVAIAAETNIAYALTAGAMAAALAGAAGGRSLGGLLARSAFIGLGVSTALSDSRGDK